MKRLLLIANLHSGREEIRSSLAEIIDIFTKTGFLVTCCATQYTGHATEFVQRYGSDFDRIVCCGGDGTANEVLNGMMTLSRRPPMGMIPTGTINDYAHSLSIPSPVEAAAETAAGDLLFPIDVGCLNGRYFNYVAAFGIFTNVAYETDQNIKNVIGPLAYLLEGLKSATQLKSVQARIEYDDGMLEGKFLIGLFSNSISIAGVRTAYKDALLDDGKMEICLVKDPVSPTVVQDAIEVLLAGKQISNLMNSSLEILHTRKAVITCSEPLAWTVDGESGGSYCETVIDVHKQAVTVVTGQNMNANSIGDGSRR